MRSKKLLGLLLVFCMVLSCITPAAAIQAGSDSYGSAEAQENLVPIQPGQAGKGEGAVDSLGLSADEKEENLPTLRGQQAGQQTGGAVIGGAETAAPSAGDEWNFSAAEGTAEMEYAELPAFVQDLKAAAQVYGEDDMVSVFVVMEEEPLANRYSSINSVPARETQRLKDKQNNVIDEIERFFLEGRQLPVEDQFTYLINAFTAQLRFGDLQQVAQMADVAKVVLMPVFYPCGDTDSTAGVYNPYTAFSGAMSGVSNVWEDIGYSGEGMTIAILDTGIDLDHPSFAADPVSPQWDKSEIEAILGSLNASSLYPGLSADDVYYNAKIPFYFSYGSDNNKVGHSDGNDHGTHVAGIAAANKVEGTDVVGMAPNAQLIVMDVFQDGGGAYMGDILEALEDAMRLGVDVVNMSLGTTAGFSQSGDELIDSVYASIAQTELVVNVSAGNDGTSSYSNMWGTNENLTQHPDNAAISSPSTYANVNSIASVDNSALKASAISVDGKYYMYNDAVDLGISFSSLAGQELEFVMVGGWGEQADFEGLDLSGKIAVVSRGVTNFSSKLANAEAAGAIGLIVVNNVDGSISNFGMSMANPDGSLPEGVSGTVPAILVSLKTGAALQAAADAGNAVLSAASEPQIVADEGGGQVSSFSSWGVSPDLRLLPDMAGVGGNIYSCYDGGNYGYMSGTSMSSPQVAGVSALVIQYLKDKGMADSDIVDALLMSTAVPVVSQTSGVEASPRQQGAGLVNALNAVTAGAYITVDGGKPKAELGDDPARSGSFSFSFTVHNFSDSAQTYALSASLLTEAVDPDYEPYGLYFMAGYDRALEGSVSFSSDSVTVAAGSTATVTATVTLSAEGKAWLDKYYANGGYVEGYVYLSNTAEGGVDLNLPYLGYYGDWTDPDVFDTAYWYDNSMWIDGYTGVDGNEYWHILWTQLLDNDWVLGINPYSGAMEDENGNVIYDPANNVVSPNGDGLIDNLAEIYISLMRNADAITFDYTIDGEEEPVYSVTIDNAPKTMYMSSYGQVVPFVYGWYDYPFEFTYEDGSAIPSGTKMTITVSASVDYEGAGVESISFPVTIDTNAPELLGVESVTEDDKNYLVVTCSDESSLAAVFVMNESESQTYGVAFDPEKNDDGSYTAKIDITGCGNQFKLILCDYGANEGVYQAEFEGDNAPDVDTDLLYAYRVFDAEIYDDSAFGWVSIDKETAEITQLTNDMYEYYAINAAEYVGGYVFAVDAGYNFLYMEPGVWNRNVICNLGVNVLDMTWDATTNTMYLTAKDSDGYGYLYSIDLLTCELTEIAMYDSQYSMPWAMAATDDGVIYAVKYYSSNLVTVNKDWGYMEDVLDADGNPITLLRADGKTAYPYYAQSMTYSAADECIYWGFFTYTSDAELFKIIPESETAAASYSSVEFPVDAELVGMFTMDEDEDFTIPESEAVSSLIMGAENVSLAVGASEQLSVTILPWNYTPAEDIVWTVDDESVATVAADGTVTGVGEGTATVTASCEGVSASCTVVVLEASGTVYAYNYYSSAGWGDWFSLGLEDMSYASTVYADVDLISADYNGHDGYIYGYDEGKNFYRVDPATGESELLGSSAVLPYDLAYDYSTGFMYAMEPSSYMLYYVNMRSGAMVEVGMMVTTDWNQDYMVGLACSTDGTLYAVSANGVLYTMAYDADFGYVMADPITYDLPYPVSLLQSMCYEHNSGKLVWACADMGSYILLDPATGAYIDLGSPYNDGDLFQHIGLHSIPENIPELPYSAVESVEASDMVVFVGASKTPVVSVMPLNATNQTVVWTSLDETVALVNADGSVTGVAPGTAVLEGSLTDGENVFEVSINVTVMAPADNIYGYLMTDIATYSGYCWLTLDPTDPTTGNQYVADNWYSMLSAEYVEIDGEGLVYGFGYDDMDWEANMQFMTFDPDTLELLSITDMGEAFPFVYDMAYDYTTGTMFALVGYNDSSSDLYMIDLASGQPIMAMALEQMCQSLVIDENGKLYAISDGSMEYDWWFDQYTYNYSKLLELDPVAGTCTELFDLGCINNKYASAAYDFDTGYIYWTRMAETSAIESSLCVIDIDGRACYDLGTINAMGAQVTSLFIKADEYPDVPDELVNITLTPASEILSVGETLEMGVFVQPSGYVFDAQWSSSDESVASVDENGLVTALTSGVTTITVTVADGENEFTSTSRIIVFDENDYLISYNASDAGFAAVDRLDPTNLTALSQGESEAAVRAMENVNGYIYGYDVDGRFFMTTAENNFQRNYLGEHGIAPLESALDGYVTQFDVRDMAWDASEERMLVLGCHSMVDEYGYWYEADGGCRLYEMDMETGALTELLTFVYPNDGGYYSNVYTITVDDEGTVYTYSTFIDYFGVVDMSTGVVNETTTLQNQSVYGTSDGEPMAMVYDPMTETIYLLFTSNGSFYQLINFDPATGKATVIDKVGEVTYEDWMYNGAKMAGLVLNTPHEHVYDQEAVKNGMGTHVWLCACGAQGETEECSYEGNVCTECGALKPVSGVVDPEIPDEDPDIPAPDDPDQPDQPDQPDVPPVEEEWPFVDVDEDDWFYAAVKYCYENGLMNGVSETEFAPMASTNRAMIVTILYRLEGSPAVEGSSEFTDVAAGQWYTKAVIWASENAIVNGYGDGRFGPLNTITREQMAAIIYRYANYKGYDVSARADLSVYTDAASISSYAVDAMSWANAVGLINGRTETTLVPSGSANRAEAAVILMRFSENVAE